MFKKVLAIVLVVVLTATVAIGGTLAYLTDRESEANVFTLGDVEIKLNENFEQGATLIPGVNIEKSPTITNTGKNDAWVWATIAFPKVLDNDDASKNVVHFNYSGASIAEGQWTWKNAEGNWMIKELEHDDVVYNVYTVLYQTALKPGETTDTEVIYKLYMDPHVDIDTDGKVYWVENGTATDLNWNVNEYGNPIVYISAYAIQTEGFETVQEAYAGYNNQWGDNGIEWGTPATVVDTADELIKALENGEDVLLTADVELDRNTTITIPAGKSANLNLGGHTLSATADKTGNQEMFLVKGNMTVKNGRIELTAENNQGWNSMATIFDVTAGGVLNLEDVTANVSGTDMNFIVHLNNWGTATLHVNNCDFTTTYCAVRAFNSGYDMNNVTIENTSFHGGRMFWVHNYTSEGKDDSTLNLDIYGNNNTSDSQKPVRFGFSNSVYYDLEGNLIN